MEYERRIVGEMLDLGGLLVAYVFVGLPVGSTLAAPPQSPTSSFGLTVIDATLLSGAVVIALAESTGNRPGPVESIAFFGAYGFVQLPLLGIVTLLFDAMLPLALANACALLAAYVLAIRWGPAGTARRFRSLVKNLIETPGLDREPERDP